MLEVEQADVENCNWLHLCNTLKPCCYLIYPCRVPFTHTPWVKSLIDYGGKKYIEILILFLTLSDYLCGTGPLKLLFFAVQLVFALSCNHVQCRNSSPAFYQRKARVCTHSRRFGQWRNIATSCVQLTVARSGLFKYNCRCFWIHLA